MDTQNEDSESEMHDRSLILNSEASSVEQLSEIEIDFNNKVLSGNTSLAVPGSSYESVPGPSCGNVYKKVKSESNNNKQKEKNRNLSDRKKTENTKVNPIIKNRANPTKRKITNQKTETIKTSKKIIVSEQNTEININPIKVKINKADKVNIEQKSCANANITATGPKESQDNDINSVTNLDMDISKMPIFFEDSFDIA